MVVFLLAMQTARVRIPLLAPFCEIQVCRPYWAGRNSRFRIKLLEIIMTKEIAIIIPVYKAHSTVRRALSSLDF